MERFLVDFSQTPLATTKLDVLGDKVQYCNEVTFYLNGKKVVETDLPHHLTLLEYLRKNAGLTGAKLGCGEGGCGACCVLVSHFDRTEGKIKHLAVNACLMPFFDVDGKHVITTEGLGNVSKLHPIQRRIAELHGSQCGFCTPGIVMSLYAILRNNPKATKLEIENAMDGNLCRCTGYRPILDAAKSFAVDATSSCPMAKSGKCCQQQRQASEHDGKSSDGGSDKMSMSSSETQEIDAKQSHSEGSDRGSDDAKTGASDEAKTDTESKSNLEMEVIHETACALPEKSGFIDYASRVTMRTCTCKKIRKYEKYDGSSELIFPPALMKYEPKSLKIQGKDYTWYSPTSMKELLQLKKAFPAAKIVVGNTEVGIETRFKKQVYPIQIGVQNVPELHGLSVGRRGYTFTAGASLADIEAFCKEQVLKDSVKSKTLIPVLQMLRWFASNQVRNTACVGGNLATASPISDLNPIWQAESALMCVQRAGDDGSILTRKVHLRKFFLGYRKVDLATDEVIVDLHLPFAQPEEFLQCYKLSRRREDDIAICTGAFRVQLASEENDFTIKLCGISFAGMAETTKIAESTEQFLTGKKWTEETINKAIEVLNKEMFVPADSPGGMEEYRGTLCGSFLFKFYVYVSNQLYKQKLIAEPLISDRDVSAAEPFERGETSGYQEFEYSKNLEVGKPIAHLSAASQTSGEAVYVDDMGDPEGTLHGAYVLASKPHANIISVDVSKVREATGFHSYLDKNDIEEKRNITSGAQDEEIFCSGTTINSHQVVGLVLADSHEHARNAANLAKIEYEELDAIITIDDAIAADSFYPKILTIVDGDIEAALAACDNVIEGEMRIGGQEHFYLEPQSTLAVAGELDEMTIHTGTQDCSLVQTLVARVLGVPLNRVNVTSKRIGGGFGGKASRFTPLHCACAFASRKTGRPIRMTLERDVDMKLTGGRHAFMTRHKLGFSNDGKIEALDVQIFNNGGSTLDTSLRVMEKAIFQITNTYKIKSIRSICKVCKTNTPTCTAFRGFGAPQAQFMMEDMIERVSSATGRHPNHVREHILMAPGEKAYYGQVMSDQPIKKMWGDILESSNFAEREEEINEFNSKHKYKKRGIAVIPTQYGVGFGGQHLNQSGALVHIYRDGSVNLTHGGSEMGQGLFTKMIQIAASALGCPIQKIYTTHTSTETVPNTSKSAASASSDLNGMAVWNACQKLVTRLEPIRKQHPQKTWDEVAQAAYLQRIGLSATGFHKTKDIGYDFETGEGNPWPYYTYGVCCSEIELDVLTGDFQILRNDMLVDVGASLNPALDVGQIEGSFAQGMGLFTIEEMVWGDDGHKWVNKGELFTSGPGTYKVPSFNDTPIDFRVTLMKDALNPTAIHSSKGIGEPALFLGATVLFALRHAIRSVREENGLGTEYFPLQSPATCERIRMACADRFTKAFTDDPNFTPKLTC